MTITAEACHAAQPGDVLKDGGDYGVKGLELRARAGVKSWHLYYRAGDGTQRRPKLGTFPTIKLPAARRIASELLERIKKGEDPSAERQELRGSPTVNDLCDLYIKLHLVPEKKKPSSIEHDEINIKTHVRPRLGHLKVAAVTTAEIDKVLKIIAAGWTIQTTSTHVPARPTTKPRFGGKTLRRGGKTAANRVRSLVSKMFNLAESKAYGCMRPKGSNPVGFKTDEDRAIRFRERRRRVRIQGDQWQAMARALEELRPTYPRHVGAIWVILYAGSRVTELITGRSFQLKDGALHLDEHKTDDGGDVRTIRLPRQAMREIERLPVDSLGRIFGELDRGQVYKVWCKARAKAGCPGLRVQDLRRTFASAGKSMGVQVEAVSELFNHADPNTTQKHYAFLFDDAAVEISQTIADRIEELIGI